MLMFHAGDGLLKVPKEGVNLAELTIGRTLGCRTVELMRHYQPFLVADQSLLVVPDATMRAAQATVGTLLVPRALSLESNGQVLRR